MTNEGITYVEYNKTNGNIKLINADKSVRLFTSKSTLYSVSGKTVQAVENTFSNYEYTKYRGGEWQLRRPKDSVFSTYHFNINQTDSNKLELENYKKLVENLDTAEKVYIVAAPLAAATVCAAIGAAIGTAGAATPASIIAATGATGATLTAANLVVETCEDCYDKYFTIFDDFSGDVLD